MTAPRRGPHERPAGADAVPTRPPDMRLAPAAGAAWAVMLLGLHTGPAGGVVGAALAGGLLLGGLLGRRAVLVAAGGCSLAAALVITAHAVMLRDHPVRAAAGRGATATLHVVGGQSGHGVFDGGNAETVYELLLGRRESARRCRRRALRPTKCS